LRGSSDGGRRYRIVEVGFDTRATLLSTDVEDGWEPAVRQQWIENKEGIVKGLLDEYGPRDGDRKVDDFVALGPAPWSIVAEHNTLLAQVRSAFALGAYYPALVGAAALGERLLNELVLTLREDYLTHPSTSRRIRAAASFTDWPHTIEVLHAWGVLDDATKDRFESLKTMRHESVHYTSTFASGARDVALAAVTLAQQIVSSVFSGLYRPGITINELAGLVVIRRTAEEIPLVKRFLLPRSVLVSPRHTVEIQRHDSVAYWSLYDDAEYPTEDIDDAEYARRYPLEAGQLAINVD